MAVEIERGHVTIARSLMRDLCERYPEEFLFGFRVDAGAKPIRGPEAVAYLDALPPERTFLTDCPQPTREGRCGCFSDEEFRSVKES